MRLRGTPNAPALPGKPGQRIEQRHTTKNPRLTGGRGSQSMGLLSMRCSDTPGALHTGIKHAMICANSLIFQNRSAGIGTLARSDDTRRLSRLHRAGPSTSLDE